MSEFFQDQPEATKILEDALDDARKKELGGLVVQALTDPNKFLSPEEVEAYERAQQSVVDARESAIRNEGQGIIL